MQVLRNDGNKTKTRAILLVGSKVEPSAKLCNINSQLIRYIYIYTRDISCKGRGFTCNFHDGKSLEVVTGSSHTRHFNLPYSLPPDFPRQILQPPCFPMVCACRVAATKLLERKTGSSDIRSRDALIVLKVDSFIYCPTNHGKWRGFSLSLSLFLYLYLYPSLSLSQIVRGSWCRGFRPPLRFSPRLIADAKEQKARTRGRTREFYSLSRATFLCDSKTRFKDEFHKGREGGEKKSLRLRRFEDSVGENRSAAKGMRRLDEGWLSSSLFLSRVEPVTKKRTLRWKAWTKFASWLWSGCKRRDRFRCHEKTGDVQWAGTIDWGCSGVNGRNVFREGFKNAENKLDVWTKKGT